jgi:hypothetical protein
MKFYLSMATLLISTVSFGQVSVNSGLYFAKEYSKDVALYKAKEYVMNEVIGVQSTLIKFQIDPLAAASSGELTSLIYKCEEKNLNGLVLGFYGNRWNDAGVIYQAYAFKNIPEVKALEILSRLEKYISDETKFLTSDADNNNMYFQYDDMVFLFYYSGTVKMRVFWNGFDSEWESTAFDKTLRRFTKKLKK